MSDLAIETRKCGTCKHITPTVLWPMCKKKLMVVTNEMRVTYQVDKGTCYEAKESESSEYRST